MNADKSNKLKDKVAILTLGNIESHGFHNPDEIDSIVSNEIAKRISQHIKSSFIFSIPNGVGGMLPRFSLELDVFYRLLYETFDRFSNGGVKKILVLNSHFPNDYPTCCAADEITQKHKNINIIIINVWSICLDQIKQYFKPEELEHGGKAETSLLLYLTDSDKIENIEDSLDSYNFYNEWKNKGYFKYPVEYPKSGFHGIISGANKEDGKKIYDIIVNRIKEIIKETNF